MDNGVNVTDAGILAALRGVGVPYGGGYGYGPNSFTNGNFVGDGSAVNANVVANRSIGLTESINTSSRDLFLSNQISRGNDRLSEQYERGSFFLINKIDNNRIDDRFNALVAQIHADQLATQQMFSDTKAQVAECCCETRAGIATIIANQQRQAMEAAQAEAAALRVIVRQNQGQTQS